MMALIPGKLEGGDAGESSKGGGEGGELGVSAENKRVLSSG